MVWQSLEQVLGTFEQQRQWQKPQQLQSLLRIWPEVVGEAVAAHTRPQKIQRSTLLVATSSAVWAQNLSFERHRILAKLQTRLSIPIRDIHFSSAAWYHSLSAGQQLGSEQEMTAWKQHPSQLPPVLKFPSSQSSLHTKPNLRVATQHWRQRMQTRSHTLPACPDCGCPTPPGELQRWGICAFCASKHWT